MSSTEQKQLFNHLSKKFKSSPLNLKQNEIIETIKNGKISIKKSILLKLKYWHYMGLEG
jgi:hypothetical protein